MSNTVHGVAIGVRAAIRDTDPGNYAISTDELFYMILAKSVEMAGEVPGGVAWSAGVCTTSAGDGDSTISQVPGSIMELRNATEGVPLRRASVGEVHDLRQGTSPGTGRPHCYYLTETAAGVTTITWGPIPDAAYSIDALLSVMPSELATAATVIPFDHFMVRAIQKAVQVECLLKMDGRQLEERRMEKAVIPQWSRDVESLIVKSRKREGTRMRPSHVAPAVY